MEILPAILEEMAVWQIRNSRKKGRETMTEKELSKLRRGEMLEMLVSQAKEIERLKWELDIANKSLKEREITIDNAGSIAEAALQINGVFEAAQKAAEQYLENIENRSRRQEETCAELEEKSRQDAEKLLAEVKNNCEVMEQQCEKKLEETNYQCEEQIQITELKCEEKIRKTDEECEQKIHNTEEMCNLKIQETEKQVEEKWKVISQRLEEVYQAKNGLRELVEFIGKDM